MIKAIFAFLILFTVLFVGILSWYSSSRTLKDALIIAGVYSLAIASITIAILASFVMLF